MNIIVSEEIKSVCPEFAGAMVYATVKNTEYDDGLWRKIESLGEELRASLDTESLKLMPPIQATRHIY